MVPRASAAGRGRDGGCGDAGGAPHRLIPSSLWEYRRFLVRGALDDLRQRYAGSGLGAFWNVLYPLLQILVFTLVFGRLMAVELPGLSGRLSFTIYLCAGLLPWLAFADEVQRGTSALVDNASYMKKLPIPEAVFVARAALGAAFTLGISMLLLVVLALVAGVPVGASWLAVAGVLALFVGFGYGLALFLATLNVFLRDVGALLGIVLQLWMWLTPIVYLQEILPPRMQELLWLNPAYPFVDALHRAVVQGAWPPATHWLAMAAWSLTGWLVGGAVVSRWRSEIRDAL